MGHVWMVQWIYWFVAGGGFARIVRGGRAVRKGAGATQRLHFAEHFTYNYRLW